MQEFRLIQSLTAHVEKCPCSQPYQRHLCSSHCSDWSTTQTDLRELGTKCPFCERTIGTRIWETMRHIKRHMAVKPFMCVFQLSFTNRYYLVAHVCRRHLVQNSYKCVWCPKSYFMRKVCKFMFADSLVSCFASFEEKSTFQRHVWYRDCRETAVLYECAVCSQVCE